MREIKFRGRDEHGEWHYGAFMGVFYDGVVAPIEYANIYADGMASRVFPDTVGQYTGLKDCEGREIYEGDVIRAVTKNPYWGFKKNHAVEWDLDGFCLDGEPLYYWFKLHDLKVIGNVHDDPDLLEAAHD